MSTPKNNISGNVWLHDQAAKTVIQGKSLNALRNSNIPEYNFEFKYDVNYKVLTCAKLKGIIKPNRGVLMINPTKLSPHRSQISDVNLR